MSWDLHHTESERLAHAAQAALAAGDQPRARDLYRQAAESEERALAELDSAKPRTRGITAVSALSLWLKGAEYQAVRRRSQELLGDESLPQFAKAQIREILQSVPNGVPPQRRFEVEITFRQTLRYAVDAASRRAAEQKALSRWKDGDESDVPGGDVLEVMEVQAHTPSKSDREQKDAASAYRYLRDRELVIESLDESAYDPAMHDAVSAEEVALHIGWNGPGGEPDTPRAALALDRLCSERRVVRFTRDRARTGEKGQVYLYCTPQHLVNLSAMILDEEMSETGSSGSTSGREIVVQFQ